MTTAVIILTFNEAMHIERAIQSVQTFANEILVVDSFSSDRTLEIARACGATILQRKFDNQARQFNWALDTAPITSDWIMRLDADEVIEPDLAQAIRATLPALPDDVVGVALKRKHIFLDRWIRHGGRYPLTLLRLWRRGHGRVEDRWMDEHVLTTGGRTITLDGGFADHNLNDLSFFIDKHNKYATREAVERLSARYGLRLQREEGQGAPPRQAAHKKLVKAIFYNRLPFGCGPLAYFLYRYFIQLGILDGKAGFVYHFLQGFWYRFLVEAKLLELDRLLAPLPDAKARFAALERATGLKLGATQ